MIVIFKEITFLYITENDPSLNSSLSIISNQLLLMFRDNHLDSFRSIFTRKDRGYRWISLKWNFDPWKQGSCRESIQINTTSNEIIGLVTVQASVS